MTVYNGNEPYIFISYAHSDTKKVLPIIEHMQQAGIPIWYDDGIEAGTEWPQYIAERLAGASCILVFLSPNSANSHNCRNEINLASELKKEFLVVHLMDFELPLGLKLQLNSNQAIFKSRFKTDVEFMDALATANILQKYKTEQSAETTDRPSKKTPQKAKNTSPVLLAVLGGAVLLALILGAIIGLDDKTGDEGDPDYQPTLSATENATGSETVITSYDQFYEKLLATNEKLQCGSLWTPSKLIDNYKIDQGDGDVWVTYYTDAFQLENTSLHIGFRNDGVEIMGVLNSFKEQDLNKAYKIIECLSSAINGYYFTDFTEVMVNDDRVQWRDLGKPRSVWNEVLGLEEPAFLLCGENTETLYKTMMLDDLIIHVERRCRSDNGQKYFDFTILWEHPDNM